MLVEHKECFFFFNGSASPWVFEAVFTLLTANMGVDWEENPHSSAPKINLELQIILQAFCSESLTFPEPQKEEENITSAGITNTTAAI